MIFNLTTETIMKKIILTLLLTLSTLVNVNAVAAFSLDVDGNGSFTASNDGLVIFKYLLNSNANNLHTTISSNAPETRDSTPELRAYLDGAGDILDVDGNGSFTASNDGLIIFKYLLNSNANNLHTTISSNAPETRDSTPELRDYLDRLESESNLIDVSVGSSTIQGFDSYATGCVAPDVCEHNFVAAIGIEQGGKLSAADGSTLYDNFVEHFASGPLIKDSIPQSTSTDRIWLPPNSSSCNALFFNDKMKIYNPTANDISVMRLINSSGTITSEVVNQARNNCSMVGPADQDLRYTDSTSNILVDPVTVTANAFTMFNINGQKLDLNALETAKILFVDKADYDAKIAAGEPLTFDSCMQMEFSIQGDSSRPTNASDKDSWVPCIQSSYEYLNTQPGTPIANAGSDQSVAFSTTVNLSGSATDSDGTIVSYAWTQIYGTTLTLTAADSANASFDSSGVDDAGEVLTFALTVTDNDGVTARDNVIITVAANPDRLIANAGIDQSDIEQGATVTLTGSATVGTGTISNYAWQQISGATISITGANSATASFVAPSTTGSEIVLQLTVTDSSGATATDNIIITVLADPSLLIANAGIDQSGIEPDATVTLTASTTGGTGTISSYVWQQISGEAVSITGANSATASFVAPRVAATGTTIDVVLQLTVTDSNNATATDTITITVDAFVPVTAIIIGTQNNDGTQNTDYIAGVRNGTPITYALGTNVTITPANATKQTIVWSGNGPSAFKYSVNASTGLITSNRTDSSASDVLRATIVGGKLDGTSFLKIKALHIQDEHYGSTCNSCHNPVDGSEKDEHSQYYDQ